MVDACINTRSRRLHTSRTLAADLVFYPEAKIDAGTPVCFISLARATEDQIIVGFAEQGIVATTSEEPIATGTTT